MAIPKNDLFTLIPYGDSFLLYSKAVCSFLYFRNKKKCLITGQEYKIAASELEKKLKENTDHKHIVFHAFYECGDYLSGFDTSDTELGIWIEYQKVIKVLELGSIKKDVSVFWEELCYKDYCKSFDIGKAHLERGDCYQYNLTRIFKGKMKGDSLDLVRKVWSKKSQRGAYSSFTYSSVLKRSFLSNSPECLFQVNGNEIEALPIKGTIKLCGDEEIKRKELGESRKNESELNMITDLLLHDINGLTNYQAYVNKKKSYLKVPGLLHSYSSIKGPFNNESIYTIFKALFPGGSITGAPKKRVREIIKNLEPEKRGFYCGSTVIKSKTLFAASINIRSIVIDEVSKGLTYGAGGGVTFASTVEDEYAEMLAKKDSFNNLIS